MIAKCCCALLLLFQVVLVVQVKAQEQPSERSCSKRLAAHIRQLPKWNVDPPKDIYGNATAPDSIAWTWTNDKLKEIEAGINKQINKELFAHYTYLSMAAHFSRDDIYLPGFVNFFKKSAEEENKHAQMLIEFQNRRGGRVKLHNIMKPCRDQWGSGLTAMRDALALEKDIYVALLELHAIADQVEFKDPMTLDYLESNFLNEQLESIKTLANYVNTLQRIGGGLGEYQFDKLTLGGK